jgi:hypothetical protein
MRVLFNRTILGLLVATLLAGASTAAQDGGTAAAEKAVSEWLSLVDHGRYAESWTSAAAGFRKAVTQETWEGAVHAVREPIGAVKTRTMKGATATRSLPGAPDGDYVVLQFDASFEHKASALETVTAVREPDGTWHVAGYFIK